MKAVRHLALVPLLTILAACTPADTLTQEKLDQVQEGMSAAQVKSILGSPTDSKSEPIPVVGGTKTTYVWDGEGDHVTVILKNDTVQSKEGRFTDE